MHSYITFGQTHIHRINGLVFDKNCVAVIESQCADQALMMCNELFGTAWSYIYSGIETDMCELHYYPRGLIEVTQ